MDCYIFLFITFFINCLSFRLNLFYDQGFCISLECHDTEEDVQDFTKRLMALSQAQEVREIHITMYVLYS